MSLNLEELSVECEITAAKQILNTEQKLSAEKEGSDNGDGDNDQLQNDKQ